MHIPIPHIRSFYGFIGVIDGTYHVVPRWITFVYPFLNYHTGDLTPYSGVENLTFLHPFRTATSGAMDCKAKLSDLTASTSKHQNNLFWNIPIAYALPRCKEKLKLEDCDGIEDLLDLQGGIFIQRNKNCLALMTAPETELNVLNGLVSCGPINMKFKEVESGWTSLIKEVIVGFFVGIAKLGTDSVLSFLSWLQTFDPYIVPKMIISGFVASKTGPIPALLILSLNYKLVLWISGWGETYSSYQSKE